MNEEETAQLVGRWVKLATEKDQAEIARLSEAWQISQDEAVCELLALANPKFCDRAELDALGGPRGRAKQLRYEMEVPGFRRTLGLKLRDPEDQEKEDHLMDRTEKPGTESADGLNIRIRIENGKQQVQVWADEGCEESLKQAPVVMRAVADGFERALLLRGLQRPAEMKSNFEM